MRFIPIIILIPLLLLVSHPAEAQRTTTTYESLLQRAERPNVYSAPIIIPKSDEETIIAVPFRIDYDFLPFTRVRTGMELPIDDAQYFSRVQMSMELYRGAYRESRREGRQVRGSSIFRDTFIDTVFVRTYEETGSRTDHLQGVISATVPPENYHYELRLTRGDTQLELPSRIRMAKAPSYSKLDSALVVLASAINETNQSISASLMNFGDYVLYGQDYEILFVIPEAHKSSDLKLTIQRLQAGSRSPVSSDPSYEVNLQADQFFRGSDISVGNGENGDIILEMNKSKNQAGPTFTSVSIPNSGFENARFRLTLHAADGKEISRKVIHSRWIDMPVSLLNIDVAIDMMRFIVSREELERLKSGSSAEKEQKFREFWAQRDPTPDTEFNELMAEYYSRIDQAYQKFTSLQQPGYETDQGRAYILYGPPDNIERRLPANRPTREVWEYSDRTLIFEATTGFGDFRLVSER